MRPRHSLAFFLFALPLAAFGQGGTAPGGAASSDPMPATPSKVEQLLEHVETERSRTEQRRAELGQEIGRLETLVAARGRALVRLTRAGLLPVGGGFDALVDHASRIERLRRALGRDLRRYHRAKTEHEEATARLATLRERSTVLEAERESLARSHAAILAAEERELAFRRAFDHSGAPMSHTAVYGSASSLSLDDVERGFGGLKGRLPFPLEGRTEIRRVHDSGSSVGLEMAARAGAPVVAVYPGRVAFADEYPDRGLTVLLDHGGGYYTVSGRLGHIDVVVGDEVQAGQRLGRVGSFADGAVLYFELRREGRAVDPSPWFGI